MKHDVPGIHYENVSRFFRDNVPGWLPGLEVALAWVTVVFCLVRGFFTVREALPLFVANGPARPLGRSWEASS